MSPRGILYVHWNRQTSAAESLRRCRQLRKSLLSTRATRLPTCLVLDESDDQTDTAHFDHVMRIPFEAFETAASHPLGRRLLGMLKTPFEETLCLHADTRIVRPDILFPFEQLGQCGYCMAIDRHLFGAQPSRWRNESAGPFETIARALIWPPVEYLPLYNSGVVFYRRSSEMTAILEAALALARSGVMLGDSPAIPVSDEVALSLVAELRDVHPYGLSRVWNSAGAAGEKPTAATRILHPASE